MEVAEERAIGAFAVRQSVQIGEQRIAKFASFSRSGRAAEDRCGGRPQVGAIGSEEVFPGGLASRSASGSQGQIFQIKCGKIILEFLQRGLL